MKLKETLGELDSYKEFTFYIFDSFFLDVFRFLDRIHLKIAKGQKRLKNNFLHIFQEEYLLKNSYMQIAMNVHIHLEVHVNILSASFCMRLCACIYMRLKIYTHMCTFSDTYIYSVMRSVHVYHLIYVYTFKYLYHLYVTLIRYLLG